jgi:outer membrane protein TolC
MLRLVHSRPLRASIVVWRGFVLSALAVVLTGCASSNAVNSDGGFGPVAQTAQESLRKALYWARTEQQQDELKKRVDDLLQARSQSGLTADDAVQLALLNNRGLQAAFFELGVSEAEWLEAGRLENPKLSLSRLSRDSEHESGLGVQWNFLKLLTLAQTRQVAQLRLQQTQADVAQQVLDFAAETRKAYFVALAAEENLRYARQVKEAAAAAAELAQRMAAAGNFNRLEQAREQSFSADAELALLRAEQASKQGREQLLRLLALEDEQLALGLVLPATLPALPTIKAFSLTEQEAQTQALTRRLDVQAAKAALASTAENLGLSKTTRFVNVLELGWQRNRSNQQATQRGYEVSFELPLFDWGTAKVARAEALYMQALNRTAEVANRARSEVRQAYQAYHANYAIARQYRDEIVPLKKQISEQNLRRYNGMLIGVFDLLADAREQIASVQGSIEALRDFWLAQSELERSLAAVQPEPPAQTSVAPVAADPHAGHQH